jgi:hypothetical protein
MVMSCILLSNALLCLPWSIPSHVSRLPDQTLNDKQKAGSYNLTCPPTYVNNATSASNYPAAEERERDLSIGEHAAMM